MTSAALPLPVLTVAANLPLCVDLDGTLVRSDTLVEGFCALASDPRVGITLLSLANGRAAFKQAVAAGSCLDPALLPYNDTLLMYLRAQKTAGRYLVLATAADRRIARAIAIHLGIFDEVMASDGTTNLKGQAKALALAGRFGSKGFVYAGNATSDLPIWRQAAAVILVNAPAAATGKLRGIVPIEFAIDDRPVLLPELLKAMRPHQWLKNVLVFIPILTAHALTQTAAWVGGMLMFAAFCFTASAIYLVNDLLDIAADRTHPRKRLRPFARGAVSLPVGAGVAAVLLVAGLSLAFIGGVAWVVALYALMSISYSFGLKRLPLVDVFMLGGLYTIRLFGGGEATGHRLSLWLLGFSSLLFLSLALLKRVEEMMSINSIGGSKAARRGYSAADTPILQLFGVTSAFASSIVLALFVQSEATAQNYASPSLLWLVVPLLLFWQCRMWLSGARGYMHHDPIVYAARDRISWAIGATTAAVLIAAKSVPFFAG